MWRCLEEIDELKTKLILKKYNELTKTSGYGTLFINSHGNFFKNLNVLDLVHKWYSKV